MLYARANGTRSWNAGLSAQESLSAPGSLAYNPAA